MIGARFAEKRWLAKRLGIRLSGRIFNQTATTLQPASAASSSLNWTDFVPFQ